MSGVTTSQFQEVLNEHGYGFHYSVLGLVDELEKASKSNWCIDAVEFPVEVGKFTTKIDFILKRKHGNPFYILAECKRANPAFSRWFFARAPYSRLDYNFEHIDRTDVRSLLTYAIPMPVSSDEAPYHIALEVKTDKKGDRSGKSDGIEGAVTQLCVGLNGMVEFFARNLHIHGNETSVDFLPVLFTTAEIYTTGVDLRAANIIDGNIDLKDADIQPKPWIAYQYHQSPSLKHGVVPGTWPDKIGEILDFSYVRTVLVVSALGIDSFLDWASNLVKVQ